MRERNARKWRQVNETKQNCVKEGSPTQRRVQEAEPPIGDSKQTEGQYTLCCICQLYSNQLHKHGTNTAYEKLLNVSNNKPVQYRKNCNTAISKVGGRTINRHVQMCTEVANGECEQFLKHVPLPNHTDNVTFLIKTHSFWYIFIILTATFPKFSRSDPH
jgi:hypothetical protein